MILVCSM